MSEVPDDASAILARIDDQLDTVLAQARRDLAAGNPQTTVEIGRKLVTAAQGMVAQGYFPNIDGWLVAFAASAVQRLAHVEE